MRDEVKQIVSSREKSAADKISEAIAKRKKSAPKLASSRILALTKRRNTGDQFELKPDFRVLYEDENVEIREYPPHRRTITVSLKNHEDDYRERRYIERKHFLPMPHCVFARRKKHPEGIPDHRLDGDGNKIITSHKGFYLGFAKKPIETSRDEIYMPFLPNMYEDYKVCEGSGGGHNFDNRVSGFWGSSFLPEETPNGAYAVSKALGIGAGKYDACFEAWAKLTPEEVAERMNYAHLPIDQTHFGHDAHFGYDREAWEKEQELERIEAEKRRRKYENERDERLREERRNRVLYGTECPNCAREELTNRLDREMCCYGCDEYYWAEDHRRSLTAQEKADEAARKEREAIEDARRKERGR